MVAISAREADSFTKSGFQKFSVVLFFGPDEGLVSERAEEVAAATVGGDIGNIVRFDGDEIAAHPERLAEEAHAISMFGGARAIRIRAGGKALTQALAPLLSTPPIEARIIVEAGDLKPNAPLRGQIEKAASAAAAPCYAEDARDLARLVDQLAGEAGLAISSDARQLLISILGVDRKRSRSEIDKLLLYAAGEPRIELHHVEAIVSDAAAMSFDALIDAAFGGKIDAIELEARRLFSERTEPGVLLGFGLRHAFALQAMRRDADSGKSPLEAVKAARISWKRERAVVDQLSRWHETRLARAVQIIGEATLNVRRNATLGEAIAIRAFWSIGLSVGRG